jgi:hypothetical protein
MSQETQVASRGIHHRLTGPKTKSRFRISALEPQASTESAGHHGVAGLELSPLACTEYAAVTKQGVEASPTAGQRNLGARSSPNRGTKEVKMDSNW